MADVRLLGPIEVEVAGERHSVGGPRLRRLLGSLALVNGRLRSTESLIDAVWADGTAPPGARRTIMSYVSRLRRLLGHGVIEQLGHGYRLDRSSATTDLEAFERRIAEAHGVYRAGDCRRAIVLFDDALALWRDDPLGEFAGEPWAEPERQRLAMLRLSAVEDRFAAKLDLNEHAEILADLAVAADERPERERLLHLHMSALDRAGQQTTALARYESARRRLAEMGLEPSPELRDLEIRILTRRGDAAVGRRPRGVATSPWKRETVELDVACIGHTWRDPGRLVENGGRLGAAPFLVEGWIYPPGTIPVPGDGFVPTQDGSVGRWLCRGNVLVDADPSEAQGTSAQEFVFDTGNGGDPSSADLITTSGIEGAFETARLTRRSIIGGTGRYLGASGQQVQSTNGLNTSVNGWGANAPNFAMRLELLIPAT